MGAIGLIWWYSSADSSLVFSIFSQEMTVSFKNTNLSKSFEVKLNYFGFMTSESIENNRSNHQSWGGGVN